MLGDEQKGQDRSFRSWTKNVLNGASKKFNMELGERVENSWPFDISRTRVRKSTWKKSIIKKTNHSDGKNIYVFLLFLYIKTCNFEPFYVIKCMLLRREHIKLFNLIGSMPPYNGLLVIIH